MNLKPPLALFAAFDWSNPRVAGVASVSVALALAGWLVVAIFGRRAVQQIGVDGLSIIAVLSGLHVVVSYASRISGYVLSGVLGPLAVFVAGLSGEGLTSLLFAVVIVLVPRPGAFAISSLTVFTVNSLFTGQFGVVEVLYVTISMVTAEICLALLGVTIRVPKGNCKLQIANCKLQNGEESAGANFRSAVVRGSPDFAQRLLVVRVALAIGLANMATLYAQYCVAQFVYRLYFAAWYVAALAVVTGLVYGSIGAALGVIVGQRLRKTAP